MGMMINRRRVCGGKSLPYDAEIEYLESTGTQYIDTEIYPNPLTDGFAYNIKFINDLKGNRSVGAVVGNSWDKTQICYGICGNYMNAFFAIFDNFRAGRSPIKSLGHTNIFNEISVINKGDYDGTKFTLEVTSPLYGVENIVFNNPYNGSVPNSFIICGTYEYGRISELSHIQIKYFKLLRINVPILDLIPVRVGNVGYMYDKVSGQLFGNAGTGSFILGPDI